MCLCVLCCVCVCLSLSLSAFYPFYALWASTYACRAYTVLMCSFLCIRMAMIMRVSVDGLVSLRLNVCRHARVIINCRFTYEWTAGGRDGCAGVWMDLCVSYGMCMFMFMCVCVCSCVCFCVCLVMRAGICKHATFHMQRHLHSTSARLSKELKCSQLSHILCMYVYACVFVRSQTYVIAPVCLSACLP